MNKRQPYIFLKNGLSSDKKIVKKKSSNKSNLLEDKYRELVELAQEMADALWDVSKGKTIDNARELNQKFYNLEL